MAEEMGLDSAGAKEQSGISPLSSPGCTYKQECSRCARTCRLGYTAAAGQLLAADDRCGGDLEGQTRSVGLVSAAAETA